MNVQLYLPTSTPTVVTGQLTVTVSSDGRASVGWDVRNPETDEQISLEARPPQSLQDAQALAQSVLQELLRVLPTVVDCPPFD